MAKKLFTSVASTAEGGTNVRRDELCRKIALYVGSAEKRETDVRGLTLVHRTAKTAPVCITYQPSIAVIVQEKKQVRLGPNTFIYDESKFLLTSVDLPVVSTMVEASKEKPFVALALNLEMPVVREIIGREEFEVPAISAETPGMVTAETTPELLSACCRLVDLLDTPQDIPFLSGLIQREIIYRILSGAEGARLRAIATLGDQSHRTNKAITWIRENYAEPLRLEYLAKISGMGVSALHHHFRALTAMSPLQYQKQLRLQTARARMLTDGIDAASVAFAVGYESASQFNREYSHYFGQPPMRDIRTLRSPGSLPLE